MTKTSPLKKNKRDPSFLAKSARSGFTLLEILLVVALLAGLASVVVPNIGNVVRVGVQSSVRRFSALIRYGYDQSVLTGKVHRIVLNLDTPQSWFIEAGEPGALPIDVTRQGLLAEGINERDRVTVEPGFQKVEGTQLEKIPSGVRLLSVESWRIGKEPATKGKVSIYLFPGGFVDNATVYLAEEGKEDVQKFKITVQSLSGRISVEAETKRP